MGIKLLEKNQVWKALLGEGFGRRLVLVIHK